MMALRTTLPKTNSSHLKIGRLPQRERNSSSFAIHFQVLLLLVWGSVRNLFFSYACQCSCGVRLPTGFQSLCVFPPFLRVHRDGMAVGCWTNPFEKYESKWESSPSFGVNINIWYNVYIYICVYIHIWNHRLELLFSFQTVLLFDIQVIVRVEFSHI